MLTYAAICPHPPTIIPGLRKKNKQSAEKTIKAMNSLASELKKFAPQTLLVISPHGPMRYDKFTINLENSLRGNFSKFGTSPQEYKFTNDTSLAKEIFSRTRKSNLPVEIIRENNIDYGSLIPLYYLTKSLERKPKIILLTYTAFDWEMHFNFGLSLGRVIKENQTEIGIIASGDLSHRLTENAPAGFSPYGSKFDQTLTDLLEKNDTEKIKNLNPEFCDEAGECGLRSILIALGALSFHRHNFNKISYEHPTGIGYLVGNWRIN